MAQRGTEARVTQSVWPSARTVIATVAVLFLLYFGRGFFVPIALAFVFAIVFRPVVRFLERRRVPTAGAASIVMVATLAGLAGLGFALSVPLQDWAAKVPESVTAAQAKLAQFRRPMQQLSKVADQLQSPAEPADSSADSGTGRGKRRQQQAQPQPVAPAPAPKAPGFLARAAGTTTSFLASAVETILLLWLLLASGNVFYVKLLGLLPAAVDRRRAAEVATETEAAVVRYLVATALINVGQAAAVGLAVWLLGMPNPLLWGMLTFAFEFVPYLGGAVMVGLLTIVAFTTFKDIGHILAVPGSYLAITTLQNNLVSPFVYGQRLRLNPVAVLIGVLFWWSLWGVAGAFIAVPIIATAKILGDHNPRLRALGELLGD